MKNQNFKIGIYVPCYNVEKVIRCVFDNFSLDIFSRVQEIVCVDNCSQDQTLTILKDLKDKNPILNSKLKIIHNRENYGLGGSQKIAYKYFMENGFSHFMIIHGDGQGNGNEIALNFFKVLDQDPSVDVIFASRFLNLGSLKGYSQLRILGNIVFNFLTRVLTGCCLSDTGTGIIFIKVGVLKNIPLCCLTNSFQFNPQLSILLSEISDVNIKEISLSWQDSEAKSNIIPIQYCLTLLKILVLFRFNKTFLRKKSWESFGSRSQDFKPIFDIF
jgi:glycosyltransferase involved in cell wall biosynthesis